MRLGGGGAIVPRAQAERNQTEGINFAVIVDLLIGLKATHRVNRVVSPFAIGVAFEVTSVCQCPLNRLVAIWIRMELIARSRRRFGHSNDSSGARADGAGARTKGACRAGDMSTAVSRWTEGDRGLGGRLMGN